MSFFGPPGPGEGSRKTVGSGGTVCGGDRMGPGHGGSGLTLP